MPQDKQLLDRARRLRNRGTPFEAILWRRLSRSQLGGYKFRRQHVIGDCIVDFFCPRKALIVEIDGDTHDGAADRIRDEINRGRGYSTVRFTNADVGTNIDAVLEILLETLDGLPDRWPPPQPLPRRGGDDDGGAGFPSPLGEGKGWGRPVLPLTEFQESGPPPQPLP